MPHSKTRRNNTRISLLPLTALSLLGLIALPADLLHFTQPAAHAASAFTVNSTGDAPDSNVNDGICNDGAGHCTLRAAIQQANATSDNDTINFSVTGTINLTGRLTDIFTTIDIKGPGPSALTVRRDTGGDYVILTVSPLGTANVSGLTLTNGKGSDGLDINGDFGGGAGRGGGVANFGTLSLTNVVVTGNRSGDGGDANFVAAPGGEGAGIVNFGGTLTLRDCAVTNNVTGQGGNGVNGGNGGDGGGIYNTGTLTLTDCVISGNRTGHAGNSSGIGSIRRGGSGGGIFSQSGTVTLLRVTIRDNTTGNGSATLPGVGVGHGGEGGGLFLINGDGLLKDCAISGNRTGLKANDSSIGGGGSSSNGTGGGITSGNGSLTIYGSTISNNTSDFGGAIYSGGSMTLTNSTVSGNHINGVGECIINIGKLLFSNSTITNNEGVGVRNYIEMSGQGSPVMRNTLIAGNGLGIGGGLDVQGKFVSQGHNIVGNAGNGPGTDSTGFGVNGDQIGYAAAPIDPKLGPLQSNGGLTSTHALLLGSPALDAGGNSLATDDDDNPLTTDQRGRSRFAGPGANPSVDVGAFEFNQSMENVSDKATSEDTPLSFALFVGDQTITSLNATSDNQALVPDANIDISAGGAVRTVQINPAADRFGTANITFNLNGSHEGIVSQTFALVVAPVNDAPSFTKGADQTVPEDAGAQTVTSWATAVSAGPNEAAQTLTFLITGNTNPGLFSSAPAVSPAGALTYTPSANASGSATITLALKDNGGTAGGVQDTSAPQTFVINVTSVNDPPVNSVPAAQGTNTNTPLVFSAANSNAVSVSDVDAGTDPVRVTLSATLGTLTLGSKAGLTFVSGDGTDDASFTFEAPLTTANAALNGLTFKPDAGVNGSGSVTIDTNDRGFNGSGGAQTDTDTIAITIMSGGAFRFNSSLMGTQENVGTFTLSVTRAGGSFGAATVDYTTALSTSSISPAVGGTACPGGADYINTSGTLSFASGEESKAISITICDDLLHEADDTFLVRLSNPTGSGVLGLVSQTSVLIADDDPIGGIFELSQATYTASEGAGLLSLRVRRRGLGLPPATVDYATDDGSIPSVSVPCSSVTGLALDRCDFARAQGTLYFSGNETEQTLSIPLTDDSFVEGTETALIRLSNPTGGATLGTQASATLSIEDDAQESSANPIDDSTRFVRQHYHDFLNRDPDAPGLAFWTNEIEQCGANPGCREVKRINVSAAFFLSIEFQQTGYLVHRIYKVAYGDIPDKPVPLTLSEFLSDTQTIGRGFVVGQADWEVVLNFNKRRFADAFVARPRFQSRYPASLTPEQYVDGLNANAGGALSQAERDALVADLRSGTRTRAQVLRVVAEDADLSRSEFNRAFVLMQYFGYLRRDPDSAPDQSFAGYNFWLSKLNEFNGNFINAEMVKAFISSDEYRKRFGQ